MKLVELIQWQWQHYRRSHQSRANLLAHIVLVPVFVIANIVLLGALAQARWAVALGALVTMIVSIALQGRGHAAERHPPEPFTSPGNALARILTEQWITFPRFVLSGAWLRALRRTR